MADTDLNAIFANLCPFGHHPLTPEEVAAGTCRTTGQPFKSAGDVPGFDEFLGFFEAAVGKPRGLQRVWARKILRGESFTAVAATGIGKTTLGAFAALYLAHQRKEKCYVLVTGSLLLDQLLRRLSEWAERLSWRIGLNPEPRSRGTRIAAYHGRLRAAEAKRFEELLSTRAWHILVSTPQFLARRFSLLEDTRIRFCFADDVDALLKSSANTDRLLTLLGYMDRGRRRKGVLMASSATARPGRGAARLRELLGLDVGTTAYAVRNILDVLEDEALEEQRLNEVVATLGGGGLVFCRSRPESLEVTQWLSKTVDAAHVDEPGALERFERGDCQVLVGVSSYYGKLVRGLDLPFRIRYAIFRGVPLFHIRISEFENLSPRLLRLLAFLYRDQPELAEHKRALRRLVLPQEGELRERVREILRSLIETGRKPSVSDIVVRPGEMLIPDIRTYIQASGRTSRLTAGGLTRGLSLVFEPDSELREAFRQRAELYDIHFADLGGLDLRELAVELTRDREAKKREVQAGVDLLKPILVIVESPTKARQIARFFGRPAFKRYSLPGGRLAALAYEVPTGNAVLTITASLGHVTDLVTKGGFYGVEVEPRITPVFAPIKRCLKCNAQFTDPDLDRCPECGSRQYESAEDRIRVLRTLASDCDQVVIGTDPDTEGERIAWDLANLVGLAADRVHRAEFHEVTRRAFEAALAQPREVDRRLVQAQFVRRIEDRWIGFSLSELLWQVFGKHWLSAGRAQTAVLGWLVERTEQAQTRKLIGVIEPWRLEIEGLDVPEVTVRVELLERRAETRNPLPPYTTDTLLTDATRLLRRPSDEIMRLLQHLFESGLITYHRTDSTHVSEVGRRIAQQVLGEHAVPRPWSDEGAHEAIRPTRPLSADDIRRLVYEQELVLEGMTSVHFRLYDLIWRRFLASQAPAFEVDIERYRVDIPTAGERIVERVVDARGIAVELYPWSVRRLPPLPPGEHTVPVTVRKVPAAPLFSEADVIRLMRERGIGRPSTYATILARLKKRGYVIERKNRLIATSLGRRVHRFLADHFGEMISEERTRDLERRMLLVERGDANAEEILRSVLQEIREVQQVRSRLPVQE